MECSYDFLRLVIDSVTDHIAVIDVKGDIQFVNKSWTTFGNNNECTIGDNWSDINYITVCEKSAKVEGDFGTQAVNGIKSMIEKKSSSFYFEYPCHSQDEKRWFMMHVTPFHLKQKNYFVISHQNITERKSAEEKLRSQANIDGLTGIPNRRKFDKFLQKEWKRCLRLEQPISLIILDLDHFKLLNDTYGHQAGDDCLIKIATLLKEFVRRPSDICARYGGEEFVLVLGNTPLTQAKQLSINLLDKLVALNIENANSPIKSYLTASIGLATIFPNINHNESELISKADTMLYKAKNNGRNRIEN